MSKITFRADDDLIEGIEQFDASKSEIMRRALREYLESHDPMEATPAPDTADSTEGTVDEFLVNRIDELIEQRLAQRTTPQDVNVNITLDDARSPQSAPESAADQRKTTDQPETSMSDTDDTVCDQCGESLDSEHVYCPNCGEKVSHRIFCECGDELRSDWAFCPGCGRRTPAADVLDSPDAR